MSVPTSSEGVRSQSSVRELDPRLSEIAAPRHAVAFWPALVIGPAALGSAVASMRSGSRSAKRDGWIAALGAAAGLGFVRWQLQRLFTEEPAYTVETHTHDLELRRYPRCVRAETHVGAGWSVALDEGFHRLAGYIFRGNATDESIAMTAPVTAHDLRRGEKLSVTAPVTTSLNHGTVTVSFTMPPGRTLSSLPRPLDDRVQLREVPERTVAVLRFSGRFTEASIQAHQSELLDAVEDAGFPHEAQPEFAGYDPPWTLPFLRRNEVWVTL